MRKTYTKKQISEAISHWTTILQEMKSAEDNPTCRYLKNAFQSTQDKKLRADIMKLMVNYFDYVELNVDGKRFVSLDEYIYDTRAFMQNHKDVLTPADCQALKQFIADLTQSKPDSVMSYFSDDPDNDDDIETVANRAAKKFKNYRVSYDSSTDRGGNTVGYIAITMK